MEKRRNTNSFTPSLDRSRPPGRLLAAAAYLALTVSCANAAATYTGAKSCAACHPAEFRRQSESAHTQALSRTPDHPQAAKFPTTATLTRKPNYTFEFLLSASVLQTRIRDGADVMLLPMQWAFGAGTQAVTFVSKVDKDWYVEHYSTYYSALHSWGPTPGQADVRATTLPEAAGILYKTLDPNTGIGGCFECHSTGPVSFGPTGEAELTEPGVRCEACHGAGAAHTKNPSRKNIQNPTTLSAVQLNDFCGRCHRMPALQGAKIDWNYSWNVRHQPVYLSESACFRKSRGALSCLTCHDPHEPAGKKPAFTYNARCANCHSTASLPPKAVCLERKPSNCIDCHMPLVSPQSPLRFTNHWIGVYRDGPKLKPARY